MLVVAPLLAALLVVNAALSGEASATVADSKSKDQRSAVGTVHVKIVTPDGVPATVALAGEKSHKSTAKGTHFVTKAPAGTTTAASMPVPAGEYHVQPEDVTIGGRLFSATAVRREITVRKDRTTELLVTYAAVKAAQELRVTALEPTTVSLAWTNPAALPIALRRTPGRSPARRATEGTRVSTKGTTSIDKGLQPGVQYSYALFSKTRDGWVGPLAVAVGTPGSPDTTRAAYVAPPTTLITRPADVVSITTTGTGVRVGLAAQTRTPLLGSAVVLPRSAAVPGGYLGVVTTVSEDGRTVELRAGGLSDAFDFYQVDVGDLAAATALPAPAVKSAAPPTAPPARAAAAPNRARRESGEPPSLAAPVQCGGTAQGTVEFSPSVSLGGHFSAKVDKYKVLGVNLPKGASLDMAVTATVTGAMSVTTTAGVKCSILSDPIAKLVTIDPVPISVILFPTIEVGVDATVTVQNLGVTATSGVQFAAHFGLTGGTSLSDSTIAHASPLTPAVTANGSVHAKVGGQLVAGPGAGTPDAGVIAGLSGEFYPLDATFGPNFPLGDSRFNKCLRADASFNGALSLTAKAWLGSWDVSATTTLDALTGSRPYGGSPWYLPSGCENLPGPVQPGDSLLGDDVTKVTDEILGGPEQWGHVDGFAPGKTTWVLSTGNMANALGSPDQFASTDLGGPGDAGLSALGGHATFDAASYQVTLVPTGSTLHVQYVFASEEYPEYVGSPYNDVMEVLVDGQNCATVPNTTDPVSVNTVNAGSNSSYYVDNSAGAAGYSTSMDGLTVPLTCSVPVTPGQPVTVRIAVADSSDYVFDSAVALVDHGIWSD
jgi:hypothetical protein